MTIEMYVQCVQKRLEMASEMETHREAILEIIKRYPTEFTNGGNSGFFLRAVINTPEELELVISQLKAPMVTRQEAFNQSLVWPRVI